MFLKHTTCVFIGWFSLVFISTCGVHSLFRSANFDRFLATRHAGPFSLTSQVKSAEACAVKCLRNNTCNAAMATTDNGNTYCYFIETDHIATESHRSADANSVLFGEFRRHPLLTHYLPYKLWFVYVHVLQCGSFSVRTVRTEEFASQMIPLRTASVLMAMRGKHVKVCISIRVHTCSFIQYIMYMYAIETLHWSF